MAEAMQTFHSKWIDTYLAAYERDTDLTPPYYSREVHYALKNLLDALPGEDQTPLFIIVNRGANDIRTASRAIDVTYDVGVACITSSFDGSGARSSAGAYAAATLGIMMHRRDLDGAFGNRLRVVSFDDVRLDDLPAEETRSKAICRLQFSIEVRNVVNLNAGPSIPDPPTDPYPDPGGWPTVQEVITTLTKGDTVP